MSMAITTGAIALVGTGAQIYSGIRQRNRGRQVRESAVDPGIVGNYALDRISNTLFQNYSNWNLPGYDRYVGQVMSAQGTANRALTLGATSSADILNGITASQQASNEALSNLAVQSASGREAALMRYLQSVEAQGNDQVRVNNMENQRYQATLQEAAALEGAGLQNINQGIQDATIGISAIGSNFMPRTTINPNTGQPISMPSVWDTYWASRRKTSNI